MLVVLLCATRVPFDNEYIYLLRLVATYDPTFLANDPSFTAPASEHWLFNHIFGLLTFFVSIETIGWAGRIACWSATLYGLMRLGRHWEMPSWMITLALVIWLSQGQAVVGGEWIFGGFEAKSVAYLFLIFALDRLLRQRNIYPTIFLGLTFSFHPAVGLWAILGVGIAMLYARRDIKTIVRIAGITFLFMLPGLVPLLFDAKGVSTAADWQFLELVRMPQLFDPMSWPKAAIVLVYLQLAFCLIALRSGDEKKRSLSGFVGALGIFFTAGMVLRILGQWELSRLMPMRLFPIFVALFFFYSLGSAYREGLLGPPFKWLTGLALACLLLTPSPLAVANAAAKLTYRTWATPPDDDAVCFSWIRNNTPEDAIFIASPWRKDFWYRARRAQVVSGGFPTYFDLSDWRERDQNLTGESLDNRPTPENDGRAEFYHSLSRQNIDELSGRYHANYIVTDAIYPYELVFQSGKSKVYRLK